MRGRENRDDRALARSGSGPAQEEDQRPNRRPMADDFAIGLGADTAARSQLDGAVQLIRAAAESHEAEVHQAAERGTRGGGGRLPHADQIQASFGRHDLGGVKAHVGGPAREASEAMGARAFAKGNDVAFGTSPDLHTAAHEAAHVVQQRGGVQLAGGVGRRGDRYEQHADAVADAVVQGRSAEGLLGRYAPAASPAAGAAVQQVADERFKGDTALAEVLGGSKTLSKGDKSLAVRKVQQGLIDLGHLKATDTTMGTFDDATETAVKAFQKAKTLTESGTVDKETMEALSGGLSDTHYADLAMNKSGGPTRDLDSDDKSAIAEAEKPKGAVSSKGVVQAFIEKDYDTKIRAAVKDWIEAGHKRAKEAEKKRTEKDGLFEWPSIEAVAKAAGDEVDKVFGSYKKTGTMKSGVSLKDQWDNRDPSSWSGGKKADMAKFRVRKLIISNPKGEIAKINKAHNADPSRDAESKILTKIVTDYAASHEAELLLIHQNWPASTAGGIVYLQRFRTGDDGGDKTKLWDTFQTCVHEHMHTITHSDYSLWANGKDKAIAQVYTEGMTEVMTMTALANVTYNDTLRETVEGKTLFDKDKPTKIPTRNKYVGLRERAHQVLSIAGFGNACTAYFKGDTDKLDTK